MWRYDVTKFPQKKGTSHPIRLFTLKKRVFLSRIVLLDQKLTPPPPMPISTIFKQRKMFSFSKFLGRLDDERAAATPMIDQFG